jgi:hypothetical protein
VRAEPHPSRVTSTPRQSRTCRDGSFGAACHYDDGTFVFEDSEADCPEDSPESGSTFVFWHPDLVTLHIWLWYPNPDGPFKGTNRWVRPFNDEQVGLLRTVGLSLPL